MAQDEAEGEGQCGEIGRPLIAGHAGARGRTAPMHGPAHVDTLRLHMRRNPEGE